MKKITLLVAFICTFCSAATFAQKKATTLDTAYFMQNFREGDRCLIAQNADSAIWFYTKALEWRAKNPWYDSSIAVTQVLSNIGREYRLIKQPQTSQDYLFKALANARKYKQHSQYRLIHARLVVLHQKIAENNWDFNYIPPTETETTEAYFQIQSVQPYGNDSLEVIINAGKLDGLKDSSQDCRLITRIIDGDTLHHNSSGTEAVVPIYKINNNSTIIHISNEYKQKILVNDIVACNVEIPISWNKLSLKPFLLKNISFRYNADDYYTYRYYYYYGNQQTEDEALYSMLTNTKEAAYAVAKDTASNKSSLGEKYFDGVFAGENMVKAIILSQPAHVKLYLQYIITVPAELIGNYPSFVSEYARWLVVGSKLYPPTIKPYLISITDKQQKQQQIKNLFTQIKKTNIIEKWVGEALQNINEENFEEANVTAQLIKQVVTINKDTSNLGWAEYIQANIEKRNGDTTKAKLLLYNCKTIFENTNNFEGKSWANATIENWALPKTISIETQNGHTLNFTVAPSPNAKYFATASADFTIKIWDKVLGKEIKTLTKHLGKVTSIAYSPNAKYLVSVSQDKQIIIWDTYNYIPIQSYKVDGVVNVAKFSPDSKLLYLIEDTILYVINPFSDTTQVNKKLVLNNAIINDFVFFRNNPNIIFTAADDSLIIKWDLEKVEKLSTYKTTGQVQQLAISNNNRFLCAVTNNAELRLYDLFKGHRMLERSYYAEANGYNTKYPSMYGVQSFSTDSKYLVFPVSKDSFRVYNLIDMYYRQYHTNIGNFNLRSTLYTNDGKDLMVVHDGYNIRLLNVSEYNFNTNAKLNNKDISFYANRINNIQYGFEDDVLHYYQFGSGYGNINLSTAKNFINYSSKAYFPATNTLSFNKDDFFPLKSAYISNVIDIISKKLDSAIFTITLPQNEDIEGFAKSTDNTLYYLATNAGTILGYNTKTKQVQFTTTVQTDTTTNTMQPFYDKHYHRLFIKTLANTVLVLNASTGKITDTIDVSKARYFATTPTRLFITTGAGDFRVFDAKSLTKIVSWTVQALGGEALGIVTTKDNKYALYLSAQNSIALYEIATDSVIRNSGRLGFISTSIALSNKEDEYALAGIDGNIRLFDFKTGKLKATIHLPFKKDPFIVDTLNHYYASKNTLEAINVNYNDYVYPYDQFDMQLNRPDIVLNTIGRADTTLIKSYYKAYKKRIKTLGIQQDAGNATNLHLPKIKLVDRFNIQTSTPFNTYTLTVDCKDDKYKLQSLQVLVNNSPMLGNTGQDLSKLKTNSFKKQITVPLANGVNKIKVFCTNTNGVSSLKETFTVLSTYKDTTHKATVYFVGIGVAKYKDSTYNLTYSSKDIRDLAKDVSEYYKTYVIDTLLDKDVTIENIAKLKQRLQKTSPDDRVIVAVTGHGLLSDSLDFYYATYDVDFKNPTKRGLKYDMLESILNNVPAQEKIMFIDACHSGALDKEELLALEKNKKLAVGTKTDEQKSVTGIATRSTITVKNKQSKVNANSIFELMQNTFSDLTNSNGAVIVSAAGVMEYAFESPQWNNGVFTYAIREGWFLKSADKYYAGNNDGDVTILELTNYITSRVSSLTNGKQKPTSRRESIDFDWVIKF